MRWIGADKMDRALLATLLLLVGILCSGCSAVQTAEPSAVRQTVVLLHGLARTSRSMDRMARSLEAAGYRVCNVEYPSRGRTVEQLAADYVSPQIAQCVGESREPVSFVTHSLGGIIVRQLAATRAVDHIGRVVMLGSPNHGSEVVDALGNWYLFKALNGPAGRQLGTSADSLARSLGSAEFPVGIIAGDRSINWILSAIIPGEDDGKVSIESAKLEGMRDFMVLSASHPFSHERSACYRADNPFSRAWLFRSRRRPVRCRGFSRRSDSKADSLCRGGLCDLVTARLTATKRSSPAIPSAPSSSPARASHSRRRRTARSGDTCRSRRSSASDPRARPS